MVASDVPPTATDLLPSAANGISSSEAPILLPIESDVQMQAVVDVHVKVEEQQKHHEHVKQENAPSQQPNTTGEESGDMRE